MDLRVQQELEVAGIICIAERLGPEERRWCNAHGLGHKTMHPGNQLQVYRYTKLELRHGREADDFAHALLMDGREAIREGLTCAREVAEHFGAPEEMVRFRAQLLLDERCSRPRTQLPTRTPPEPGVNSLWRPYHS